ncbi:thiamine pyrophosphate-dependent enzyme [Mangrovicoccus ximenensis]|uniref:thiamine pyrophosphate-dependent enzyme n=1 Tax=Mangrovicoccus ximenensis TaxID=1911570 RepID=UPI000D363E25|nr:thiamine pyrophosphate-dependent enzyme [Mangrovicoccus ximenensis]
MTRDLVAFTPWPHHLAARYRARGYWTGRPLCHGAEAQAKARPDGLHQALPEDRVLVADLGRFVTTAWRNLPVLAPNDLVFTSHFGSIGVGLGHAIGAAAAAPGRPTVMVAGDGGFLLSGLSELASVRRESLPLVMIICNDGSYGAEHVQFRNRGMEPGLSMIGGHDFAAIAAAMGIEALRVTDADSLEQAAALLAAPQGPVLIDLCLDPERIEM